MPTEHGGVPCPKVGRGELTSVLARKARKDDREAKDRLWAREVKKRDKYRCRVVGQGGHFGTVDAHHIFPKSVSPETRHDRKAGMCACRLHHNLIQTQRIEVVVLAPELGTDGPLRFPEGPAA